MGDHFRGLPDSYDQWRTHSGEPREAEETETDEEGDKMSDQEPTCPACGVPYAEHLGLIGTCGKLRRIESAINEHAANMAKETNTFGRFDEMRSFSEAMRKLVQK